MPETKKQKVSYCQSGLLRNSNQVSDSYYSSAAVPSDTKPSSVFSSFLSKTSTTTTATTTPTPRNVTSATTPIIKKTTTVTTASGETTTVIINVTTTSTVIGETTVVLDSNSQLSKTISSSKSSTPTITPPITQLVEGPVNNIKHISKKIDKEKESSTLSQIEELEQKLKSLQNQLQKNQTKNKSNYERLAFVSLDGNMKLFNNGNWKLSGIWKSIERRNGRPLYRHRIHQHLCMCWTPKPKQWRIKSTLESPVARAVLYDDVLSPELSSLSWLIYSDDTKQFESSGKFHCLSLDKPFAPIAGPTWLDLKHALEENCGGVSISRAHQKFLLEDITKCIEKTSTLNGVSNNKWLEESLSHIISHKELKSQIQKFYYSLELISERVRRNQCSGAERFRQHMVFAGNPGTGKTMIARIMGEILHKAGILSRGHVIEVQRGDLVAGFVGQTALKTRKKITEAEGGVLFVDEAYRLFSSNTSGSDYGIEAVSEIMSVLEEQQDIAVIFAGYPKEMDTLLDSNPGLRRRFSHVFRFSDYTSKELVSIFNKKVREDGFFVEEDILLESLFQLKFSPLFVSKYNGGLCDILLSRCKESLALSLHGNCHGASDRQLNTFTEPMLLQAIDALVKPITKSINRSNNDTLIRHAVNLQK